ncbi:MAG: hypothetical protein CMI52_04870 [Parcubacteria group bacterium]|nr:hypothetical protein [Parcubacteria group bacterium]|tara:strand:- start:562 stop:918 length:357 start_codon:yes stop_codon:yes gene_type:complete
MSWQILAETTHSDIIATAAQVHAESDMIFPNKAQMIQKKPNPIIAQAIVTPIDINHPWFGHECRVSHAIDETHVMVHQGRNTTTHIRFAKRDLAIVKERSAIGMARSIGRQIGRRKHT